MQYFTVILQNITALTIPVLPKFSLLITRYLGKRKYSPIVNIKHHVLYTNDFLYDIITVFCLINSQTNTAAVKRFLLALRKHEKYCKFLFQVDQRKSVRVSLGTVHNNKISMRHCYR